MPEAPTPRLGLIAPSPGDPVASFDELMRAYTAQLEAVLRPAPQIVTTLPVSPYDGQEVYLQTAAMATAGVLWRMRYRALAGGSYKWEFLGGAPLVATYGPTVTVNTTGYTAYGGVSIVVPRTGEYEIGMEANIALPASTSAFGAFAAATSSGSASDALAAVLSTENAGATQATVRASQKVALTAGATVTGYAREAGPVGTVSMSNQRLVLTPYRVL